MLGKTRISELILNLILLLPITTLLQAYLSMINRVLIGIIIVLLFVSVVTRRMAIGKFIIISATTLLNLWAVVNTNAIAYYFNDYFYFLFFVLFSIFIIEKYDIAVEYFNKQYKYILVIVTVWSVLVFVSMLLPSSYEKGYFYSFTGNVFRMMPSAVFILTLVALILKHNKLYVIFTIIPMYCIFFGASRTYFVVGIIIFLFILYMFFPRRIFNISVIPIIALMFIIMLNSSIMNKIESSLAEGANSFFNDPLFNITSGRSLFWKADIEAYKNAPFINKLLGSGFNFVYEINKLAIGANLWAHNDYIQLLMTFGVAGLVIYIYLFAIMFKKCTYALKNHKLIVFLLLFIWFFNATFNMFYVYMCAIASYPFLFIAISEHLELQNKEM